jgi:prevent-host-death family protein
MTDTLPIAQARTRFGALVRQAASAHQRTVITDHGIPAAVIISVKELADLEDSLAIARFEAQKAQGTLVTIPHEEVKHRLGLV